MPEAVHLDLWDRHYRAELPVRGVHLVVNK